MNQYVDALKKYATFTGRASRSDYWYFVLFNIIISIGVGFIAGLIGVPVLSNIYSLAVLLPGLAVGVRRMHDVGKSGWFLLIPIYSLILAATAGDVGPNEYGPDPLNPDHVDGIDSFGEEVKDQNFE